ncbi:MAG TPA: serine protease [Sulfuricurvum kujiense]|uniref:Serine protease n=1 Tax=Sulfuricurvum kujiense TaxID=148813 RepID=A0A2D3W8L6_9BACT|nr:S8 family peptidase [Sulfuricurvum kujiense]DAB37682.1 MAG TPA: serine protease [Sulfuricurvum kujiense]
MNNLLQLKGRFEQASRSTDTFGPTNLPTGQSVNISKLQGLLKNLIDLQKDWQDQNLLPGALITVHYIKIAAKSNRLQALLGKGTSNPPNKSIVGAKFSFDTSPKHVITHYVSLNILTDSIKQLTHCINILNQQFNGEIDHDIIDKINKKEIPYTFQTIAKSNFLKIIVDAYYVEKFDVSIENAVFEHDAIITIYKTDVRTIQLLEKIGINILSSRIMDETTILLRPDELEILKTKAPFLIAMAVSDLSEITKDDFEFIDDSVVKINSPKNEPTIGVIDTLFDENVYFSEWVEYINMLSRDIPTDSDDYRHGTAVTSIIVDGPIFNPHLDDGCGRFKVRHFGVASGSSFNSFTILRNISEIVARNRDIKVWNLSLGSKLDINPNFISPEAAILDKIQFENDVVFVIAGTNLSSGETKTRALGAPADSINSIVVNSVNMDKQPSSYSRKGPVLSFFIKPDISYYGGDTKKPMRVCTPTGEAFVQGTSFAAPWIARKLSYLIDILGLSREIAKALLVHSATTWDKQQSDPTLIGHGVIPIHVKDIVHSQDDEIQFVIQGISEKYDTYNYNIPVPVVKEKHPFIAKATLCYFPACSRNQGVDYTNTELDIKFGRLDNKNTIKSINKNYQTEEYNQHIWEEDARSFFRKWDNVKHIRDTFTGKNRELKAYNNPLWGLSLKTKERLEERFGEGLKFGIVITLKEINGVNRIDEFIKNAQFRSWLVNKIDVDTRIDIFNIAEEEIEFE